MWWWRRIKHSIKCTLKSKYNFSPKNVWLAIGHIRSPIKSVLLHISLQLQSCLWCTSGLMSPTLAPTAAPALALAPGLAPALAPALAPSPASAPVQSNLLETGFDALGSLPSPTPPVSAAVAAVPIVPALTAEPATTTLAPSGGFDASSKRVLCLLHFTNLFRSEVRK